MKISNIGYNQVPQKTQKTNNKTSQNQAFGISMLKIGNKLINPFLVETIEKAGEQKFIFSLTNGGDAKEFTTKLDVVEIGRRWARAMALPKEFEKPQYL